MSEPARRGRPPRAKATNEAENKPTPLSPEELAALRAKWEAERLVDEAYRRLRSEYARAYGVFPYTVSLTEHDTLHSWTMVAINNLLTERASPREIDAATAILKEVPTGSIFTDSSSSELERRVKAALTSVRALIASEPRVIPEPPVTETTPAPIASETREEKARRLFAEGASVRAVARETGFSIGKAHQLKKGMNS